MVVAAQNVRQIREQLKRVGATSFGLAKFASRHLPNVMHPGELIQGVAYGRYSSGKGILNWTEGMLIATDRRVIFIERKPGYEKIEELTYDVVSGVQKTFAWPFASVTLYTRIGNFTVRFANRRCIDTLIHYIEGRRLESMGAESQRAKMAEIRTGRI